MPPSSLIFARVQPKSIKINEKYGYHANISNNLSVEKKKKDKPNANDANANNASSFEVEGTIKVDIPYDGHQYFTAQALDDIQRQDPNLWAGVAQTDVKARVGYLAVSEVGKSNINKKHNVGYHNVLPLEIVVKSGPPAPPPAPPATDEQTTPPATQSAAEPKPPTPAVMVNQPADLQENRFGAMLEFAYEPEPLKAPPIRPTFRIYDEPIHDKLDDDEWNALPLTKEADKPDTKARKRWYKNLQQVIKMLKGQEEFQNSLVFDLHWDLTLPAAMSQTEGEKPPEIERITIHWPVTISPRRILLKINDKRAPALYDPEKQVIEWRGVKFDPPTTKEEGKDAVYRTPPMTLTVEQPEELYRYALRQNPTNATPASIQEALNNLTLAGEMTVKIPQLLSGLKAVHFSATGAQSEVKIDTQTTIAVDFKFDLDDLFNHRAALPYLHLELGVPCDEERVNQMATILEDMGFEVRPVAVPVESPAPYHYVVAARRHGALDKLWIWMLVTWPRPVVKRPKDPGLAADFDASVASVPQPASLYMRGRLLEGKTNLIEVMNEIHRRIRNKLQPFSIVEEL